MIFLLAVSAFVYGLYMDVTLTHCARGTLTAALGMCAKGD